MPQSVLEPSNDYLTVADMKAVQQQVHGIQAASPMVELHDRISVRGGKERDLLILGVESGLLDGPPPGNSERQVFWIPYLKKGNRAFLVVCELLEEFHPEAGARESAVGPAGARQPENSLKIISGS